jgi:selenocysteine lyase/cysteine desulfurase
VTAAELRAAFAVLRPEHQGGGGVAYLNAGTCGPIPDAAVRATGDELEAAARAGRAGTHFLHVLELQDRRRAAYAERLGASPDEIALTTSTSEGIVRILAAMDLRAGQEIVTSDEEHPGLYGPLVAARERLGVTVRTVPFGELANAVGPDTALVACSHVSWINGRVCPPELARLDIPVLLDGAQGAGAVPIDPEALGASFYAASGQKWLCGPMATGFLYIAAGWRERLTPVGPTYGNLAEPGKGLDATPRPDARAFDTTVPAAETVAASLAAMDTLAAFGWDEVYERAATLAEQLADALRERGRTVAPRDRTTLVSFEDADPEALRDRLAADGVVVRNLPGTPYIRASVGAWNDESDLDRLLAAI